MRDGGRTSENKRTASENDQTSGNQTTIENDRASTNNDQTTTNDGRAAIENDQTTTGDGRASTNDEQITTDDDQTERDRTTADEQRGAVGDGGTTMLVVGDSVGWGQGLRHEQKYATLFAERIDGGTLEPAGVKAHSGAVIRDEDGGQPVGIQLADAGELAGTTRTGRREVPVDAFDCLGQVERAPLDYRDEERPDGLSPVRAAPDPAAVDRVVVTAGINDVGALRTANPFESPEEIESTVRRHSYTDLTTLLDEILDAFPNAEVVVSGYHLIASIGPSGTDIASADDFAAGLAASFGLAGLTGTAVFETLFGLAKIGVTFAAASTEYFYLQSTHFARRAVTEVDNANPDRTVVFGSPAFDRANAANADDPWVYPTLADGDTDVADDRRTACNRVGQGLTCRSAAMFHPNPTGARAMARALTARYHETTDSHSVRALIDRLGNNRNRRSLRDTLDRYNGVDTLLDPAAGLRACIRQTVVDSLRIVVETSDEPSAGNQSSTVVFDAGGYTTELDDDFRQQGFGHANFSRGAHDDFPIDPTFETDRTEQSPLRLWEITDPELRQDQPDFFEFFNAQWWKIDSIDLFINGVHTLSDNDVALTGDDSVQFTYPQP